MAVLELGTGCGIVGIFLASAIPGCSCLLTDLPEAMDLVHRNMSSSTLASGSGLACEVLDWSGKLPVITEGTRWDMVVISDCTYNPDTVPSLVETMSALAQASPQAIFLVAMKVRHDSESIFFNLLRSHDFTVLEHQVVSLRKRGHER